MAAKIFLHIGVNKTGSSAIQQYFYSNRLSIIDEGILYPETGRDGGGHYALSRVLGFEHGEKGEIDLKAMPVVEMVDALRHEILSNAVDSVVISSEAFVLPKSVSVVKKFFAEYDVKVVVYLRRHDKWWPSAYNQAVRMVAEPPWGKGFEQYLEFHRRMGEYSFNAGYRLLIDRWASVFGKGNLIIRPYEPQQNQPNIIADFVRAIGREDVLSHVVPQSQRVNDSVDMTTLALVDAFQRAKIDPDLRSRLIKYVLDNNKNTGSGESIEPELLLSLVEQNQDDYEYIAREYLGREDGRLFYDPLPDATALWKKVKQPSPAEIIEMMVAVMSGENNGLTSGVK